MDNKFTVALIYIAVILCVVNASTSSERAARCQPGKMWKEACNTCFCTDNGLAACTRMSCMEIQSRECEPGARWKDECNSCFCTERGWAACTRMGCASDAKVKRSVVKDECEPGTRWKEDCNSCFCGRYGRKECTLMECPPTF